MENSDFLNDEIKKIMAHNSYHMDKPIPVKGWEMVSNKQTESGFEGQIYKKGNDVVVVYKGTDFKNLKDIKNDKQIYLKQVPQQQQDAHNLFLDAQRMFPEANIELTGHSLGASMAQIESARTGAKATTFNPYGTGEILKNEYLRANLSAK